MIVAGGGISLTRGERRAKRGAGSNDDGNRWISSRKNFLLPVRVLSRLFRRRFLEMLAKAHAQGQLAFHGRHTGLACGQAFDAWLAPLKKTEWVVYAKPPFGGPEAVLAYLSRYTHRVAISNRRLLRADAESVTFRCKDYRLNGSERYTTMTLTTHEFIRRFLLHVLPKGFHRIRHYGLLANGNRAANIAKARELLDAPEPDMPATDGDAREPDISPHPCPRCGTSMRIIEIFERGCEPVIPIKPRGPP